MELEIHKEQREYVEKCLREIAAAEVENARKKAVMDAFNLQLQAALMHFSFEISTLIYRGMFDPSFCKPASGDEKHD